MCPPRPPRHLLLDRSSRCREVSLTSLSALVTQRGHMRHGDSKVDSHLPQEQVPLFQMETRTRSQSAGGSRPCGGPRRGRGAAVTVPRPHPLRRCPGEAGSLSGAFSQKKLPFAFVVSFLGSLLLMHKHRIDVCVCLLCILKLCRITDHF